MKTCPHCHIQVGGSAQYCPLCQNRLSGPAGEPYFPATAPRIHRASLLYKIVAFVLSALIVVAGAFDFLLMEDTPQMILARMIERNPVLQTFIDTFGLELVDVERTE